MASVISAVSASAQRPSGLRTKYRPASAATPTTPTSQECGEPPRVCAVSINRGGARYFRMNQRARTGSAILRDGTTLDQGSGSRPAPAETAIKAPQSKVNTAKNATGDESCWTARTPERSATGAWLTATIEGAPCTAPTAAWIVHRPG